MISVDTPASFEWNNINSKWVKNYLMPKSTLILSLTNGMGLDLNNITEDNFKTFCELLEKTAEGRELRNKMFKAWRSKKSRDSDNGKKMYTFNLSINAGEQLKKIAKHAPLNKTLEKLIFTGKVESKESEKNVQKMKQLKLENQKLKEELKALSNDQVETFMNSDLQVNDLAKLEKSQLIRQILILKRKIT